MKYSFRLMTVVMIATNFAYAYFNGQDYAAAAERSYFQALMIVTAYLLGARFPAKEM